MMESKESLRARYKNLRHTISEKRREEAKGAAARIDCGESRLVLSFASLPYELDTSELNYRLLTGGRLVLPAVVDDQLVCRHVESFKHLVKGRFGIAEPTGATIHPDEIGFALIPGVVFDSYGGRIGHGFGFYDRLLPKLKSKAGLCFKEQVIKASLPADTWDIPVDRLIAL